MSNDQRGARPATDPHACRFHAIRAQRCAPPDYAVAVNLVCSVCGRTRTEFVDDANLGALGITLAMVRPPSRPRGGRRVRERRTAQEAR